MSLFSRIHSGIVTNVTDLGAPHPSGQASDSAPGPPLRIMTEEQRQELLARARARRAGTPAGSRAPSHAEQQRPANLDEPGPTNPFANTAVLAIASGKGGVGKSTVTVNLAAALAAQGRRVALLDADIHGFSIPRMLGAHGQPTRTEPTPTEAPTGGEVRLLPPVAHGVKVMSIGMFTSPAQPVIWRGPVVHRALQQFLTEVDWGEPEVLLVDLPPGTGDVALSVSQLLPHSELVVVTTPQIAAAEVAERAGTMALHTKQPVAGVVENMSWLLTSAGQRLEVFGVGGGQRLADRLSATFRHAVPLLGQVPLDPVVRGCCDDGVPVVLGAPDSPAAQALCQIADNLVGISEGAAPLPGI